MSHHDQKGSHPDEQINARSAARQIWFLVVSSRASKLENHTLIGITSEAK